MNIEMINVDFLFRHRVGKDISVLDSLSFTVNSGQVVAIVGPSGCGKSTILRLVAGLLTPSKGEVLINGKSSELRRKEGIFGIVFQSPALLPWRTIDSNIRLPLELQDNSSQNNEIVQHALDDVGLQSWGKHRPHELSGGMQQRASLARALVAKPKVLLLDEPFSQLDELLRFELLFKVRNRALEAGTTVVLVTHDISEAVIIADSVFVLSDRPILKIERIDVDIERSRSIASADKPIFHKTVSQVRATLERLRRHN